MSRRVFLSSTFRDLASHRQTVQQAIRQLGAVDVSMEHFGARDERPTEECVRLVRDESDIFVGIYAHRYGFIPDGFEISVSEIEYKAATDAVLPRFIYVIDENQPWLPVHIDDGQNRERLTRFKAFLLKRHICKPFGSADQLATNVVADIGRYLALQAATRVGPGIPVNDIGVESLRGSVSETPDEWSKARNRIYSEHRNIFLTHIIKPTSRRGQTFDVFIYLIRHKSTDFSEVRLAEFFLGPYWENKVFAAVEQDGFIGIATAAYGTFLCTCRITFNDGNHIYIDRYIDFEMQRTGGAGL
jgi:hypothetical protein